MSMLYSEIQTNSKSQKVILKFLKCLFKMVLKREFERRASILDVTTWTNDSSEDNKQTPSETLDLYTNRKIEGEQIQIIHLTQALMVFNSKIVLTLAKT